MRLRFLKTRYAAFHLRSFRALTHVFFTQTAERIHRFYLIAKGIHRPGKVGMRVGLGSDNVALLKSVRISDIDEQIWTETKELRRNSFHCLEIYVEE